MSDLHRGPIEDGKDRQHPVNDPDYDIGTFALPQSPCLDGILTWYAISGMSTVPPVPVYGA